MLLNPFPINLVSVNVQVNKIQMDNLLRDINMAASIGEPVVFADDIKDPNILNVATCGTEGSVIVTQNPNLINIYKVQRKMTTSVN